MNGEDVVWTSGWTCTQLSDYTFIVRELWDKYRNRTLAYTQTHKHAKCVHVHGLSRCEGNWRLEMAHYYLECFKHTDGNKCKFELLHPLDFETDIKMCFYTSLNSFEHAL